MATITVTPECNAQIKQYAAEKGCTSDEAAIKLIDTAVGRLSAVRKYAKKIAKAPVPAKAKKAKAAKAAPAKKAKAKKAAKPAKVEAAA
jgi:hypothetical protein